MGRPVSCAQCNARRSSLVRVDRYGDEYRCEYHRPESSTPLTSEAVARITATLRDDLARGDAKARVDHATAPGTLVFEQQRLNFLEGDSLRIEGSLIIRNCSFARDILLLSLTVLGEIRIEDCSFGGQFRIENLSCQGDVYVTGNKFAGDAHLSEASIDGVAVFSANQFCRYFGHRDSTFSDFVWILDNKFQGHYNCFSSNFLREAYFEENEFVRVCTFDRASFTRLISFNGSVFHVAPTFYGSSFGEEILLQGAKFVDLTSTDAYGSYRILRKNFMSTGRRRDEAQLYYLEQAALTRSSRGVDRFVGSSYEAISGYGTSISRILASSVIGGVLFVAIYLYFYMDIERSAMFFFRQLFSPFSVWNDGASIPPGLGQMAWGLLASLQGLYFILLTALFIFALGWKFKKE